MAFYPRTTDHELWVRVGASQMVSCFVNWIGHYFEMEEGVKKERLIEWTASLERQ